MTDRNEMPALLAAAPGAAAGQLHHRQGARQADRDQPQRQDQAGSAGPAAARRRATDQPEPAGLPDTRASRGDQPDAGWSLPSLLALAVAAAGDGAELAGDRAARGARARSASGSTAIWALPSPSARALSQPGRRDQHPPPRALQQPRRGQGRHAAGSRDHRRLPDAGAGRRSARPICWPTGSGGAAAPGQALPVPDYCR